jgi:hypothetical protein
MKRLVFALLLLGGCLISRAVCQDKSTAKRPEATPNLRSTLQVLKDRGASRATLSHQLADAILLLAESGHQPSRSAVTSFADELTTMLLGRELTNSQVTTLAQSIEEVLRHSGTTTFIPASHLRETLAALGVDASRVQIITRRFIAIGEEIRGPDDMPTR